ncbi:major facilitator superfamily MFS_1 [Rhodoferax ferrireducens T118]|uniref:Major facilitator superfamily MFS_1 n=1 Tax=Albidiferax ferrireducens (strain ATCC BAA-621 / DSM 15236 / T118) TaxID=338969 RepID=Q222E1_ALBFT|nr:MFS transporter [Rhodoferax ferrireducens]ABD68112.1 major facilitator superfamily MFS_1 [Rhodoferax ferrireducens T118]
MDLKILFTTRVVRLFCYGFLSLLLALYLAQVGLTDPQIGLLFSLTLAGDAAVSLWLTTSADRFGRRRTLQIGALLMLGAGLVFILTDNIVLLMAAAIVGVISPSGNEIGPFLPVEQAGLSQIVPSQKRTQVFAWYNLAGSFATAMGALCGGWVVQILQGRGWLALDAYRVVLGAYAAGGLVLTLLFLTLSPAVEVQERAPVGTRLVLGLHRSRAVVLRLSALFALDAFAGGLILQSMIAYWFHIKFGVDTGLLGSLFFGANVLAGISALLAVPLAKRFGLINTMVFTHVPSNLLLILVPLMPNLPLAIGLLLARFSISQMDVPTRQSYTMAVVSADERSAAAGVTGIARSVGASLAPVLTGIFLTNPALFSLPFFLCGGLKLVYDLALYRSFKAVKPPEETLSQSGAKFP